MALRIRDHLSGALAQLGERNAGSVEVTGSIPVGSTKFLIFPHQKKKPDISVWLFALARLKGTGRDRQAADLCRIIALRMPFIELTRATNAV